MRITFHLLLLAALCGCAVVPTSTDSVDRIAQAIGVDAMHSEGEEARTRQGVLLAIDELAKSGVSQLPPREGPGFEALVRQNIESNQRIRRDPRVAEAYRSTLVRMLTPAELASAAAFYGSPLGRKAHIAVIEAEKAVAVEIDRLSQQASN
ncbi:DUF2059 domain-containing protein [Caldimonas sp. KR1-144]|uniref:DUF2059 domain-containing protein n=1 Tax=Caldimonas sp. KR1-144 TaxID=3400911 RepID=UPI003C048746